MNFEDYRLLANRTAKNMGNRPTDLIHAALGLASEVGEFTTEVKRLAIYGRGLEPAMREHMIEEIGDILWYLNLAAEKLDTTLNRCAVENIAKLAKRYPTSYSDALAEARLDKAGLSSRES